jgi:hypothetical protein
MTIYNVTVKGIKFEVCGPLRESLIRNADHIVDADTHEIIKNRFGSQTPAAVEKAMGIYRG